MSLGLNVHTEECYCTILLCTRRSCTTSRRQGGAQSRPSCSLYTRCMTFPTTLWRGDEAERAHIHIEALVRLGAEHEERALHGAPLGGQRGEAPVLKRFSDVNDRLEADDARAANLATSRQNPTSGREQRTNVSRVVPPSCSLLSGDWWFHEIDEKCT